MNGIYYNGNLINGDIYTADDKKIYISKIKLIESRDRIIDAIRQEDNSRMIIEFTKRIRYYYNQNYAPSILSAINGNFDSHNIELEYLLLSTKSSNNFDSTIKIIETLSDDIYGFYKMRNDYYGYYRFLLLFPYIDFETLRNFPLEKLKEANRICEELEIESEASKTLSFEGIAKNNNKILELSKRIRPKFDLIRMS